MDIVISTLIGNTWIAIVLALMAVVAGWLRRPALAHAIWVIVLVKLITPSVIHVSLPQSAKPPFGSDFGELSRAKPQGRRQAVVAPMGMTDIEEVLPAETNGIPSSRIATKSSRLKELLPSTLEAIWLVGSLACAGVAVYRIARFRRLLKISEPPPAHLSAQVAEIAERIRVRVPGIRVMPGAMPMLYGFSRSALLILPQSMVRHLNAPQRETIIAHELAHLRRGDPWVRLLETLVTIMLWWHPLTWLARRGVRVAEEQCCDAWVVATLPESRKTYAGALVDTMALFANVSPMTAPAASGLGQIRDLRRRLTMIMTHKPRKSLSRVGKSLIAALILALPIVPVVAEDDTAKKAEEVARLRDRVQQLEQRLDKTEKELAATARGTADQEEYLERIRDIARSNMERRMMRDSKKYTREQLQEAENLYQRGFEGGWQTDAAKESLKKLVEKFPDVNRAGCAVLHLGETAKGEEQEKYLALAVEKYDNCYYGDGVQVGPLARWILGKHYLDQGKPEKADKLWIAPNPESSGIGLESIDHKGRLIWSLIEADRRAARAATLPSN